MHRLALLAVALLVVASEAEAPPRLRSRASRSRTRSSTGRGDALRDRREERSARPILRYDPRGDGRPSTPAGSWSRRRLRVIATGRSTSATCVQGVIRVDARGRKTVVARIPAAAALALDGDTLYVSSLENTIERVDLRTRAVTRVAGDGRHESNETAGRRARRACSRRTGSRSTPAEPLPGSRRLRQAHRPGDRDHHDVRARGCGRLTFGRDGTLYFRTATRASAVPSGAELRTARSGRTSPVRTCFRRTCY